jgi:hypothetical protein
MKETSGQERHRVVVMTGSDGSDGPKAFSIEKCG